MKIVKKNKLDIKEKGMFGHSLSQKRGISAYDSDINSFPKIKTYRATKMRLERVNADTTYDVIITTYANEYGETREEKRVLEALIDKEIYDDVEKMLSSYERLRKMKEVRQIDVKEFLAKIKERFKEDIHFAYKSLKGSVRKSKSHTIYIYHLILIFIASITIINDISFKPPIYITITSLPKGIKIIFSSTVPNEPELTSESQLKALQGVEVKLAYVASLCREENISNSFQIYDNKIISEFNINDVKKEQIKVYSREDAEESFFSEFIELFNYKGREEEEEEQES